MRNSLYCDITGKIPSRKADQFTLASRDTVQRYFLSVAMICAISDHKTHAGSLAVSSVFDRNSHSGPRP